MGTEKEVKKEIFAITLIIIIFISIIGTFTILTVTEKLKESGSSTEDVHIPSVSLTILPETNEQKEDELTDGNK